MATPRTRLPRVSAGCFQKIPRFAPISSGFNTPYRSISQFGRTMKHKSLYLFYIKNKRFSDEKHIHPACFVSIRYDTM